MHGVGAVHAYDDNLAQLPTLRESIFMELPPFFSINTSCMFISTPDGAGDGDGAIALS
jgi:hypothetical protein